MITEKFINLLLGYDEILLDHILSIDYKTEMINTFNNFIKMKFGDEILYQIKMIA
jgi:hypothetical protein